MMLASLETLLACEEGCATILIYFKEPNPAFATSRARRSAAALASVYVLVYTIDCQGHDTHRGP